MTDLHYTGSCLCGGVRYTLSAEPGPIEVCYCHMCRKGSGGPLATNAPVAAVEFVSPRVSTPAPSAAGGRFTMGSHATTRSELR